MLRSYQYFISKLYYIDLLLKIINNQLQVFVLCSTLPDNEIGNQFDRTSKSETIKRILLFYYGCDIWKKITSLLPVYT